MFPNGLATVFRKRQITDELVAFPGEPNVF